MLDLAWLGSALLSAAQVRIDLLGWAKVGLTRLDTASRRLGLAGLGSTCRSSDDLRLARLGNARLGTRLGTWRAEHARNVRHMRHVRHVRARPGTAFAAK